MALAQVSLDDRYALERGRVLMTGIQALVRLPMLQRQRDRAAGLNTAGFISGYRGSPLGGLDQALWRARKFLEKSDIVFQPGVNEELARHRGLGHAAGRPVPGRQVRRRVRAVVRQGPGRRPLAATCSSTATPPAPRTHGGVLVVAGDDHAAKSSTLPHQTDHVFTAAMIPVLNPSGVQDDPRPRPARLGDVALLRLLGRRSRRSTDTVESSAVGRRRPGPGRDRAARRTSRCRRAASTSAGPTRRWRRKRGCRSYKVYAALAYARANRLEPHRHRQPAAALRHHHHRQVLSRRAPGAGRPRHRRARSPPRSACASTRSA